MAERAGFGSILKRNFIKYLERTDSVSVGPARGDKLCFSNASGDRQVRAPESTNEGIDNAHTRLRELDPVPRSDRQTVDNRGGGDETILDRHVFSGFSSLTRARVKCALRR